MTAQMALAKDISKGILTAKSLAQSGVDGQQDMCLNGPAQGQFTRIKGRQI